MRILVTGGCGFIGSHYVRSLLNGEYEGYGDAEVTVLDKLTYAGNLANLIPVRDNPRLEVHIGDIADPTVVTPLVERNDIIVNFAAETHVDRSITDSSGFVRSNVLGTQNLLECARHSGVSRFVHVSTDEVYGSIDTGSWTEEWPLEPNSPYAAAKAGADLFARAYSRTWGMDVVVTRCTNNYGPYQHPEKLIPLFITNLIEGEPVPLYGDGKNVRDWLHVDDHCRGIQLVLQEGKAGEVYNIGGGEELTNMDITGLLLDKCDADWDRVRMVTDRKGHDRRYSLDDTKLRRLGYRPRIPFPEGLQSTVAWYRDNRAWWTPLKRRVPQLK